ncbi:hypothetical protein HID58_006341 [Brassica napus]|uniref:Replication protein A 70 kDa DNA-binding subunit B/D first OB fold domain-containing protein n=1 Tax=Brassica napus TaxID=3708 RepID=A0ABQ8EBA8_BRANA|nr:hypothetical protein HID58_006341 [Brassica napus]
MASVTSIVDLKPFKTSWTIKVKVIRLWKQTTGGGGETIDMVLTTTHPYRISFLSKTRVLPSEQLPGDLCGFQPVKYNEVLDGVSHIEHVMSMDRRQRNSVWNCETPSEVVTQKEDLRQNNRETNSRSTIFNDITNVLGTSNRDGTNQRPVQVGQKRKLSRRDSICVSPGVDNANQNSRGTDLDCPVKKKSKGQEIMKPDTLLNVSKNNSVTISQPVKDPDFITWSSTLSSIRRHDTGLVIDCDPTQPLDKSFAPEVDVSCQTAPEVETFTTVDESDEEDSGDEYWDCSSNDADDLNSDSDIDENGTLAQRQQRQLYINKVSECFSNSFGGNTQSNAITSVSGPPTRKEEASVTTNASENVEPQVDEIKKYFEASKWRTTTSETELLVVDEMGSKIQGTFHDECMESNKIIVKEGEWYEIYNFKLIHNFRMVKTTTNRYHVVTNVNTVITKLEARLTCNYYVFKDFKTIIRGLAHPKFCIDIYGSLVFVGNLEFVEVAAGIVKPKTVFSLINPDSIVKSNFVRFYHNLTLFNYINGRYSPINCVAYGTTAVELLTYWNSRKANVVLCVLSVWQIERDEVFNLKSVGGFRFMTNIEGFSKIVFEPNIPEIEEFRKK